MGVWLRGLLEPVNLEVGGKKRGFKPPFLV